VTITFDPAKRQWTLRERDIDFADAGDVFAGLTFTLRDHRRDYGEERFQTVGLLRGRLAMIVWTPRGDTRRIISMRWCNDREQERFASQLG
jgi:uncharacterized DUF497 family protein